jgi:hypothetical protein
MKVQQAQTPKQQNQTSLVVQVTEMISLLNPAWSMNRLRVGCI